MRAYRSVARRAPKLIPTPSLALLLAVLLAACNLDPASNPADAPPDSVSAQAGVSLHITSPTSHSRIDTTDAAISLAGTANSDTGMHRVSWSNDRGGKGIANGGHSWQADSIGLELGKNTITVTAEDIAGETKSKHVVVNRERGEKGSVTLSWSAPSSRVDGTPLTNLAGYKILYGRMSGAYDYVLEISNPGVATYVVEELVSGEWFFALVAVDAEGLESDPSNEVVREIS